MLLIKQYIFSLLILCAIFYLCLFPLPEVEMEEIPFADKWAHFCMYGAFCTVLWWEYVRAHARISFGQTALVTVLFPLAVSGLIELLQAYCTETRQGDWYDMAANAVGVALGALVGYFAVRPFVRRWQKRKAA